MDAPREDPLVRELNGIEAARRLALLLCAWVWVLFGLGIVLGAAGTSPYVWHTAMPEPMRVLLWFVPAGFAIYTLFTRRCAGVTVFLLMLAPMIRIFSYLTGWVAYFLGWGPGAPFGWYSAVLHLALPGMVMLTAFLSRDDRSGA
jgi:hypothetical protein